MVKTSENLSQNEEDKFIETLSLIDYSYTKNDFNAVISHYNYLISLPVNNNLYLFYFLEMMNVYNAVFVAYVTLGIYDKAETVILKAEIFYQLYESLYEKFNILSKKDKLDSRQKTLIIETIEDIKNNLEEFYKEGIFKLYNNIAYASYKNHRYDIAVKCYQYILDDSDMINSDSKMLQVVLNWAQAKYYSRKKISNDDKAKIRGYINHILKMSSSFDSLMTAGKLYYFLGDSDKALNYIDYAINIQSEYSKSLKRIFALDWLSRITYKQKNYSIAATFYKELIDELCMYNDKIYCDKNETIHPLPKLTDMLKYYKETKDYVAKQELYYVNKSIIWAIAIAVIYGSVDLCELLNKMFNICILWSLIITIVIAILIILMAFLLNRTSNTRY